MKYQKIEIDDEVLNYLKKHAEPFEDTPNSVLRRLLFTNTKRVVNKTDIEPEKAEIIDMPTYSPAIPKALVHILEVIALVKKHGYSRSEATNLVAKKRDIAPQTVIDKYCRQLGKKAYEIDLLLESEGLSKFQLLLNKRFLLHKDTIDDFFNMIYKI